MYLRPRSMLWGVAAPAVAFQTGEAQDEVAPAQGVAQGSAQRSKT